MKKAPYGVWESSISAEMLSKASGKILAIGENGARIHWLETRPTEGGRSVLCYLDANGKKVDLIPSDYSVNSRVHEYGGGAFYFISEAVFVFVNDSDQNIYLVEENNPPKAITHSDINTRYCDFSATACGRVIAAVKEIHPEVVNDPGSDIENQLVLINLATSEESVVADEDDFYMAPKLSRDGKQIAFVSWEHPNMPWDVTKLWRADLDLQSLSIEKKQQVVFDVEHSVLQPEWDDQNHLYFVSDKSDWWNIYRIEGDIVHALTPAPIEFGFPHWIFGMTAYRIISPTEIVAIGYVDGMQQLYHVCADSGLLEPLELPSNNFHYSVEVIGRKVFLLASSPVDPQEVISYDLDSGELRTLYSSQAQVMDESDISVAEQIRFPTTGDMYASAFLYLPKNSTYLKLPKALPPAIIMSHGGPTGQSDASFNLEVQFWTTRGVAVVDVNYRGSTGYGSEYRKALYGHWGIYDVDDCISVVDYLTLQNKIDRHRVAIRGGSAGGFTTLAALTRAEQPFTAGVSRYGVSDLIALARECHKFEARYLDSVVGPLPESAPIYEQRSPINRVHNLSTPMLILQGMKDKVVPPNQAQNMVDSLEDQGLPYAYITYADEAHGFKQAENKVHALISELEFYQQIWGLTEKESSLKINNLLNKTSSAPF